MPTNEFPGDGVDEAALLLDPNENGTGAAVELLYVFGPNEKTLPGARAEADPVPLNAAGPNADPPIGEAPNAVAVQLTLDSKLFVPYKEDAAPKLLLLNLNENPLVDAEAGPAAVPVFAADPKTPNPLAVLLMLDPNKA